MKINFFIKLIIILSLSLYSCKENKNSTNNTVQNKVENKIESQTKKYTIPSNLKIENQEEIDIDSDNTLEVIITANDANATFTYEFWYKNDELIYQFKYPFGSINKKWLVNLDSDKEKEIIRMQGYEDGVDYVIYDLIEKQQIPVLYFNPVLVDSKYPNKFMWAYPNDIEGIVVNANNEVQVSLNNDYPRDDEHIQPENQKELPFIFFKGKTSQSNMKLSKLNNSEFISLNALVSKVQKKNNDENGSLTLSKNFIFKFSTSKIEDENGNEKQKIKINLKSKETNKIQVIDFIPESLITDFDASPSSSISYFDTDKLIIKSSQEIEGGHMLIVLDVNFDGLEDFAIINYQGSNAGSQYAYYVQKPNNQFILDSYLTKTIRFFPYEIDNNKKILTIMHPSGCCQIQTDKFQIQPNGNWKNIYSTLNDIKQ